MRAERLDENQRIFKDANERLEDAVADAAPPSSRIPFLCECADPDCLGRVQLTLAEYAAVRNVPERFFMLPGHALTPGESLVEDRDGYQVTAK